MIKNIKVGQLIEELKKLDSEAIIGVMDADTQWFMEITDIYEGSYKGEKAYAIGDSSYRGDCEYMSGEKSVVDFCGREGEDD